MSNGVRTFGVGMLLIAMGALILGWRHQRTSVAPAVFEATGGIEGGI
jgi:hypothetical protein